MSDHFYDSETAKLDREFDRADREHEQQQDECYMLFDEIQGDAQRATNETKNKEKLQLYLQSILESCRKLQKLLR